MADVSHSSRPQGGGARQPLARLIANPTFQRIAARLPVFRTFARRDGEALMDVLAGFVNAQVLSACVKLRVFQTLYDNGPMSAEAFSQSMDVPEERFARLLNAAVALDLLVKRRNEFRLSRKGAALLGVPGLQAMIRHHDAFYRDMADPIELLMGKTDTELAAFWPYVYGVESIGSQKVRNTYSNLMAESQTLVAQDTLQMVSLSGIKTLMDVGGGTGAFAHAVAMANPKIRLAVYDLPGVADGSVQRFTDSGIADRLMVKEGSFLQDDLPGGADVISLIRVLYDHQDRTVRALLAKVFRALPDGGRLIISEPMTGGAKPHRAGDVYFSFYTMAMGTGTARSPERIVELCAEAGFTRIQTPRAPRPFITSAVVAQKPVQRS